MNRRTFLIGTTMATSLVPGCISRLSLAGPSQASSPITSRTFRTIDPEKIASEGDNTPSIQDPPSVEFYLESSQIRVPGVLFIGSDDCKEAALEQATYNPETDTLNVVVFDRKSDNHPDNSLFSNSCPDGMSIDGYEVLISFKNELPKIVVATENDVHDDTQSTTARRP